MGYWYRLVGLADHSGDEQEMRLAEALRQNISLMYQPQFRKEIVSRLEPTPDGKTTTLLIEHWTGSSQSDHIRLAALEFQAINIFHLYVPDSSRNGLTREKVCEILDGLQEIVMRETA